MSPKKYKSAHIYIERMIEHTQKIKKYRRNLSLDEFKRRDMKYDAVCLQLSQLGENVAKIEKCEDRIMERFSSEVSWKLLKGLRNRIDYDYTWIEVEKIWKVLFGPIDSLEKGLIEILNKRYGIRIAPYFKF